MMLSIDSIRIDGGTQPRASLYDNVVAEYAQAMADGAEFPPVVVFHDGVNRWLADGFHRYNAHVSLGLAEIEADVRQGTQRDAILYSVGVNAVHGIRRTNEDKRRAVLRLLNDAEWQAWSDAEIARRCLVSPHTVGSIRRSLCILHSEPSQRTYTTKHGTVATMDTSSIGRRAFDPVQEREHVEAYKAIRAETTEAKKEKRQEKEQFLGAKILAMPEKKFGVIYADPPWKFAPYSTETGMDRSADNHYPTTTTEEICLITVPTADDAVIFLWATAPMLPDGLAVLSAWGFTYKSHIIWGKDRLGTGYWARNKHEILLIGTRGNVPAPAMGTQPESLIMAPLAEHSVKPPVFHEMIERLFPTLPKLEMFARRTRPGWTLWGYEAPEEEAA